MLVNVAKIDETISQGEYPIALKQIKISLHFSETTDELLEYLNTKLLECLDLANFEIHKEISEIINIIKDKMIFENLSVEQKAELYVSLGDNFKTTGEFLDSFGAYVIRFELGNKDVFKEIIFLNIFLSLKSDFNNIETKSILSDIIAILSENEETIEYAGILETEIMNFLFGESSSDNSSEQKYIKEFISFGFDIIETYLKSNNYEDIEKALLIIDFLTVYGFKNLDLDRMSYLIDILLSLIPSIENLPDEYCHDLFNMLSLNLGAGVNVPDKSFILMRKIRLILEEYNWGYQGLLEINKLGYNITPYIKELLESMLLNKKFNSIDESELRFGKYLGGNNVIEVKKEEMDPEILISFLLEKIDKGQALTEDDYKTIERLTLR